MKQGQGRSGVCVSAMHVFISLPLLSVQMGMAGLIGLPSMMAGQVLQGAAPGLASRLQVPGGSCMVPIAFPPYYCSLQCPSSFQLVLRPLVPTDMLPRRCACCCSPAARRPRAQPLLW